MKMYEIKGYYKAVCYDKCWTEVEANSKEEAMQLVKENPEDYSWDFKNIDVSDGEWCDQSEWEVLTDG